ncbi:MAG TPA: SprT family zinc-dependent metalloprotease [Spirochaetota bacterium]
MAVNTLSYNLVRARRKTLALVIRDDGSLEVRAPHHYPLDSIERFIMEKSAWVIKKRAHVLSRPKAPTRRYEEGEYFPYLGKDYPLLFSANAKKIYAGSALIVPQRYRKNPKSALLRWYKEEAYRIIEERTKVFARRFGFSWRTISINSATRRWGSCNSRGSLNFSYRLVMAPQDLVDFVILHELCHTIHHNHSSAFYHALATVLPDHKERDLRLKLIGRVLVL